MRKLVIWGLVLSIIFTPSLVWASPGPVDQYGGHVCLQDCELYGLSWNEYHYHQIPIDPSYLAGQLPLADLANLFYLPWVSAKQTNVKFSLASDDSLSKNAQLDQKLCGSDLVFASGLYDSQGNVRIKPVCSGGVAKISADKKLIDNKLVYAPIPSTDAAEIDRVYHVSVSQGQLIYSDRPDISELKNKLIQGRTDKQLYYIYPYDSALTIRPISDAKAVFYRGADYQSQILHFDDSIIYTYKIGQPLY